MYLVTQRTIDHFAQQHPETAQALANWSVMVKAARWTSGEHLLASTSGRTRMLHAGRVLFNIKGNHVRVVCDVQFAAPPEYNGILRVQFIGTHDEYDRTNAKTVTLSTSHHK